VGWLWLLVIYPVGFEKHRRLSTINRIKALGQLYDPIKALLGG